MMVEVAMKQHNLDVRWKQRFANFDSAFELLSKPLEDRTVDDFSDLEKEGLIQRFEYSFELAWKTMKDYLEASGFTLAEISPRAVIKEAFSAGVIDDGQCFIDMMLTRNALSHRYDPEYAAEALEFIEDKFVPALLKLRIFFAERIEE